MKKNRILSVVILLLLLVGFPLASWLYLQKGVDYRVDVLAVLSPKVKLPDAYAHQSDVRILFPDNDLQKRLEPIQDHYANRIDLIFDPIITSNLDSDLKNALLQTLKVCNKKSWNLDETAFLCDTAGNILFAYGIPEDEELARLAEHVAFVLPPEEKKDMLIKREREK
jgi:hypothetical protein